MLDLNKRHKTRPTNVNSPGPASKQKKIILEFCFYTFIIMQARRNLTRAAISSSLPSPFTPRFASANLFRALSRIPRVCFDFIESSGYKGPPPRTRFPPSRRVSNLRKSRIKAAKLLVILYPTRQRRKMNGFISRGSEVTGADRATRYPRSRLFKRRFEISIGSPAFRLIVKQNEPTFSGKLYQ